MNAMKEAGITNRGPKKRDPACLELQHAVLIPKGTILRQEPGKPGIFTCPLSHGVFTVTDEVGRENPSTYRKVIA